MLGCDGQLHVVLALRVFGEFFNDKLHVLQLPRTQAALQLNGIRLILLLGGGISFTHRG